MRALGDLLVAAFLLLAVTGAGSGVVSANGDPIDAVGRLVIDGQTFCTAFVIRSIERRNVPPYGMPVARFENWIAGAGHCRGTSMVFQLGRVRYPVARLIGYSAGEQEGFDVLVAAFETPRPLPSLEPAFGIYPQVGDLLTLIGYGNHALLTRVGPLLGYDARGHMEIDGYASSGNSGGPVLLPGTRQVVGIGIEATIDRPAGTLPMHCALKGCGVKPPYVAAHIDRLKGIAAFHWTP